MLLPVMEKAVGRRDVLGRRFKVLRCLSHTAVKYMIGLRNPGVGEKSVWR